MEDQALVATWEVRRKLIMASLAFCAFCVLYILFFGTDTKINETIATAAFTLAGAVIGSYVFGVAWTDRAKIGRSMDRSRSISGSPPPD